MGELVPIPTRTATDLIPIWCAGCGKYLDRAFASFVARYPKPRCWRCARRDEQRADERRRRVLLGVVCDVLTKLGLPVTPPEIERDAR